MTEVPNFEERVLNKLDRLEEQVNDINVSLAKNYVTRKEFREARQEAVKAKRWAIGMILPFLVIMIEVYFR